VSPRTLQAGGTIRFTLRGYPAGETVNVKIDDGVGYSNTTVQGAGVVYQQVVAKNGTVSGSFPLPAFVKPGKHWLRFLASQEMYKNGKYLGVKGFTNHSPNFTVVAASNGSNGSTGGNNDNNGAGNNANGNSGANTTGGPSSAPTATQRVPGSTASSVPSAGGVVTAKPSAEAASGTPDAVTESSSPSSDSSAEATPVSAPSDPSSGGGFPVVGASVLLGAVVVAGLLMWLLLGRRGTPRPSAK